ncbi:MAG: DUF4230 domain-containing protein [Bacteroidaceae bacterium]|nr:DUF4230 domain-containing protein [Bacteroidaceae bacterium]
MKLHFLLLILFILPVACHNQSGMGLNEGHDAYADSTDLVLRISRQSRLYTAECKFHKIVTHEDLLQWEASVLGYEFKKKLPIGNRKIAIPIDVTLKVYIDFSDFSPSQVRREEESIHIILPDPRIVVSSSRVDHKGIRQYTDITRHEYTDEEMTSFTRQGVQSILKKAPETGILDTARENAAALLVPLLTQLGYKKEHIRITFKDRLEETPLELLYDNEGSVIRLTKE